MKILLLKDVIKVGRLGQVVEVKNGFGRNYLIPLGLARLADSNAEKEAQAREARIEAKQTEREKLLGEYQKRIGGLLFEIKRKANEKGHLFASVSAGDIIKLLKKEGIEVEEKDIEGTPLKSIGEHVLKIHIGKSLLPLRVIIEGHD